ncbi:hypothetical protein BKA61DRAFT_213849, partial [Leptodontidium sp. MPI-SDFR-AT-0119]
HGTNVKLDWGHPSFLCIDVVACVPSKELFIQMGADGRPQLVRKTSPPLAILPDVMNTMSHYVDDYVKNIAFVGLDKFVDTSYIDQHSMFPERLLRATCRWFSSGLFHYTEFPRDHKQFWQLQMLQKAIEIHILTVVMERSLFLTPKSLNAAQKVLGQEFHRRSAPRFAQRQIKLVVFDALRSRLISLLKDWEIINNHAVNREDDWAAELCVLLILILVADKVAGSALYFCEARIKHHGYHAKSERAELGQFVEVSDKYSFGYLRESFHSRYGTRRGGKESFNPIRDGMDSWRGAKEPDSKTKRLVEDLIHIKNEFDDEINPLAISEPHPNEKREEDTYASPYMNAGRLASVLLRDLS